MPSHLDSVLVIVDDLLDFIRFVTSLKHLKISFGCLVFSNDDQVSLLLVWLFRLRESFRRLVHGSYNKLS
jgi:hypothetical protein